MALAMPLFLATVIGLIQASLLLQTYCNATYACRNAARFASMHSTTSLAPSNSTQIQAMVQSGLFLNATITPTISVNYFNASNLAAGTPNVCNPPVNSNLNVVGNVVCVKVTWNQGLIIPFITTSGFSVGTQAYKIISR
jgi:Flp pilus assembly protein TadG